MDLFFKMSERFQYTIRYDIIITALIVNSVYNTNSQVEDSENILFVYKGLIIIVISKQAFYLKIRN